MVKIFLRKPLYHTGITGLFIFTLGNEPDSSEVNSMFKKIFLLLLLGYLPYGFSVTPAWKTCLLNYFILQDYEFSEERDKALERFSQMQVRLEEDLAVTPSFKSVSAVAESKKSLLRSVAKRIKGVRETLRDPEKYGFDGTTYGLYLKGKDQIANYYEKLTETEEAIESLRRHGNSLTHFMLEHFPGFLALTLLTSSTLAPEGLDNYIYLLSATSAITDLYLFSNTNDWSFFSSMMKIKSFTQDLSSAPEWMYFSENFKPLRKTVKAMESLLPKDYLVFPPDLLPGFPDGLTLQESLIIDEHEHRALERFFGIRSKGHVFIDYLFEQQEGVPILSIFLRSSEKKPKKPVPAGSGDSLLKRLLSPQPQPKLQLQPVRNQDS